MFLKQFFDKITQQSSFFLGCDITRKAAVIDPDRSINKYLQLANSENFEISHIVNTVGGMEQISGSRFLAEKVNATVLFSSQLEEDWKYNFNYKKIYSGDRFQVGAYSFEALQESFHLGDKISYLITNKSKDNPYLFITDDFVIKWKCVVSPAFKKMIFNPITKSREKLNLFTPSDNLRKKDGQHFKKYIAGTKGVSDFSIDMSASEEASSCNEYKRWILSSIRDYSDNLLNTTLIDFDFLANNKNYAILDRKKNPDFKSGMKLTKLSSEEWIDKLSNQVRVLHIMESNCGKQSHLPNSIEIKTEESLRIWLKKLEEYGEDYIIFSENEDVHSVENVMVTLGCEHALGHFCPTNFYWSQQKSELSMV